MKILYCDLRAKWTVEGHRYFDVKWCHLLSSVADVTLLCFDDDWYKDVGGNIAKYIYDVTDDLENRKWLSWKLWTKGNFRRLSVKDHMEADLYIRKILELNKEKHFDYIMIGALDIISYRFYRNKLKKASKLALIEHSVDIYRKGILNKIFLKIKDDFVHIVMEEDGAGYLSELYGIDTNKIRYIPHMLNHVSADLNAHLMSYDVVGISNSNDDNEISKIIDLEKNEGFFENNGIKAIFRSKNIEYDDGSLKVFKGRLGLSYEEYYTYITKARVMVLPFSDGFGLRSSGTIMDAFSENIPIIGNPFRTMIQYNRKVPHICRLYVTTDEFKTGIIDLLNDTADYQDEYKYFQDTHSDEFIINQIRKTFV